MVVLNPNVYVQLIACTIGCIGFALLFKVKGKQVFYSGIGAFITWITYMIVYDHTENLFLANMAGAIFVAGYANVMARVNKAPTTIFLSASVFPLIPGARLYYMMYNIVLENSKEAVVHAKALVITCLAIAVGYIVVEIFNKYVFLGYRMMVKKRR